MIVNMKNNRIFDKRFHVKILVKNQSLNYLFIRAINEELQQVQRYTIFYGWFRSTEISLLPENFLHISIYFLQGKRVLDYSKVLIYPCAWRRVLRLEKLIQKFENISRSTSVAMFRDYQVSISGFKSQGR